MYACKPRDAKARARDPADRYSPDMAKAKPIGKPTKPSTVTAYIAAQPPPVRGMLVKVRAAIRAAVPAATEDIAYGLARYKLDGTMLLYFAGWKQHYSLYPAYPSIAKALAKELAPYAVDKGTIRFPLTAPVPEALIARIAKLRAAEVRAKPKRPR